MIIVEFKKLKNSRVLFPILLLPIFSIVLGSLNYYNNRDLLTSEWISLWSQAYLFYGMLFFPCLVGIICAYIWNSEHKNNNLKLLLSSSKSFFNIVLSKIFTAFCLIVFAQSYFIIIFIIVGQIFKFQSRFPLEFIYWMGVITLGSFTLICMQCYFSLKIKAFATPVALAVSYAIISLLAIGFTVLPELKYIFCTTELTMAMNHFPAKSYSFIEYGKMFVYNLILSILLIRMQVKALKNMIK